jgi:predicted ATPase
MKNISERKKYYDRIIRYLKHIIPRFDDFALEPFMMNNDYIQLNWKEKESDYIFGPHQLSDGSLRYIALASLLLQPPDTSPSFIIIDKPELGLHPSAISSFAGMVKSVSQHKPIILATQSTNLIDEFHPNQIMIVERQKNKRCSELKRLDEDKLKEWIERYSISELWEKNVIGGRAVRQLIRLHIIAEGQTEERFVKDTLSEYLGQFQISTASIAGVNGIAF